MMTNEIIYNTANTTQIQEQEPVFEPYILVEESDPILTTKVKEFEFNDPNNDPVVIASRLVETAKLHGIFNIAANQCGLAHRVFVAGNDEQFVAMFNPEIISESKETSIIPEIDISNMGLQLNVKRPSSITVQYQDFNGETHVINFAGLTARVLQNSIDRLDGIDFKSKVSEFVLKRAKTALHKRVKHFVRHNMIVKKD
jgi:peptide deformylase